MSRDAEYLAVYDLGDAERERVSRLLEGYGFRVQESVFELRLTRAMREALWRELEKLQLKTGFVYLYRRDPAGWRRQVGVCPPRPYDESRHAYVL